MAINSCKSGIQLVNTWLIVPNVLSINTNVLGATKGDMGI